MTQEDACLPSALADGNRRFRDKNPPQSLEKYVGGQKPHTAILCCSDSRVPPEIIFDTGIGELFVVRDAGNVAIDEPILTSLEYAVDHLGVETLLVLGHTQCGAVKASLCGGQCAIFHEIRACGCSTETETVMSNIRRQVSMIPVRSPVIGKAVEDGKLRVVGAVYRLEDGSVEVL